MGRSLITTVLAAALWVGCSGGVEGTPGGGGSHGGSGGGHAGSGSGGGSGGQGSGAICGGFAGGRCKPGEYCDYDTNTCGETDGSGKCKPKPQTCTDEFMPVCGCDGKTYGNGCAASAAGVDISNVAKCTPPAGRFACGPIFCETGAQYCQKMTSDVSDTPDLYSCKALPTGCQPGPTACACLAHELCGTSCAQLPGSGQPILTCPGG